MITNKQSEVLNVIRNYMEENKMAPTVREICELTNLKSTATVYGYLSRLENKGYIYRGKNRARSIILTKKTNK